MLSRRARVAAGVADQAVNSGTNFATAFIAGRLLSPDHFGIFILALSAGYVALGVQRAVVGDPLLAYASAFDGDERRGLIRDAVTSALVVGVAVALLGLGAWATGSAETRDVVWLVPWIPAVLVQDAGRYAFLCARRPDRALALDVAWAVVQGVAVAVVITNGWSSPAALAATWGIGGLGGAVAYLLMTRTLPWQGSPRRWLSRSGHLSGWFTPSALLSQTQYQIVLVLVATLLSPAATGALRAIQLLVLQPVQTTIIAMTSLLVPRAAALAATREFDELRRSTWRLAGLFAAVGMLALLAIPLRHVILSLLFPHFSAYAGLFPPVAVQAVMYAFAAPLTACLRGLQRARDLFVVQVIFAAVTLTAVFSASTAGTAVAVAWGLTAAGGVLVTATALTCRRELARASRGQPIG